MLILHGDMDHLDNVLKASAVAWAEDPGQQAENVRRQRSAHALPIIRPGKDPTGEATERRCADLIEAAQDAGARLLALPIIYAQADEDREIGAEATLRGVLA